jgi:hypothetical protein
LGDNKYLDRVVIYTGLVAINVVFGGDLTLAQKLKIAAAVRPVGQG